MRRVLLSLTAAAMALTAAAQPQQLSLVNFSSGFLAPCEITHAGDDRLFVVQQTGKVYIVNQAGVRNSTPFLDIDPRVGSNGNEMGLLGLAFHPNYKQNGQFFVNYTDNQGNTVVSRFLVSSDPDLADPNSEIVLLNVNQPYSNHNGGCMKFGPDGYLYIGLGDGGSGGDPGNRAQNPMELLGKMLRIDVGDGSQYAIPPTNPYVGSTTTREEIWAIGMRNPWKFSFDRVLGDLWIGDVGQNVVEEIDFWPANATTFPNFGWRCYEASQPFNTNGCQPANSYDMPIYEFAHSQGNCSVTGGYVYRGARYGNWWGQYFHTDYCGGFMWWTEPDGFGGWNTTRTTNALSTYNLAAFGEDVYGELYLVGNSNGIIYRLQDTTCTPHAYIPGGDTVRVCFPDAELSCTGGPSLSYQWQLAGVDVSGATQATLQVPSDGDYRVIVSNGSCTDTSNVVHVLRVAPPTVSISLPSNMFCDTADIVFPTLVPAGGILMGPGASGGSFDPGVAGPGIHQLIYYYEDPLAGCSASDTFEVTITTCVAVSDPQLPSFSVSPNPGKGIFNLSFQASSPGLATLEVLDMQGRKLHGIEYLVPAGAVSKDLHLSDLPAGVYLLRVRMAGSQSTARLVVAH